MTSKVEWKRDGDQRDAIHMIVQALVEGKVVALPSETNYLLAASCLKPEAAERVASYASGVLGSGLSLVMRTPDEALDYCPQISPVAARLVGRGMPGPLIVELPCDDASSLAQQVPRPLLEQLTSGSNHLGLRVPAHEAIEQTMRLMRGPIVVADLMADGNVAATAAAADKASPDHCNFLVDDGDAHFSAPATRVRVTGNDCKLLTAGAVERQKLLQLSQMAILVVCTGNTCRSPMAGAILKDMLRKKLELSSEDENPFFVGTAGISAFPGSPASPNAKVAMKQRGLSLADHSSSPVTQHTIEQADWVLAMTQSHRAAIVDAMPEIASKVHLVSGGKGDVSDPFGGSQAVYDACADQIEGFLGTWVDRVDTSWLPQWQFD
ncbi:MAG: Sua5/YciO/YrdC/YwlC family protein [Aureliella sp.]